MSGASTGGAVTLFLAGDVMIGRGMDQALAPSVDPELHERWVTSARRYLELAERAHGPIPEPLEPAHPWGDALDVLERAAPDARIVNLETALTAEGRPRGGKGIHYRAHPAHAAVLEAAGVDACSLANNHVLDWGREGLRDTLETLRGAGIAPFGAGEDRASASAPADLEARGRTVRCLGLGSPTAGVPDGWAAREDRSGVWLADRLTETAADRVAREILDRRREGDLALASIHWGGNWGHRVPDRQRRFARRLVDAGAVELVHGHSSHHPKAVEFHRGRPILYGCGDLINDYEGISGHEEHRPGLVLIWLARIGDGGTPATVEMVPMRLRRFRLERATAEDARWLAGTLDEASRELGTRIDRSSDPELAARGPVLAATPA